MSIKQIWKKWSLLLNIILIIFNIILMVLLLHFRHNTRPPQMQLFDSNNEYYQIQPLLIKYTEKDSKKPETVASKWTKENYINNDNNIIHIYSHGMLRLEFWELGVVTVTASIDGSPIPVRRTDGQYFIEFKPSNSVMLFEVTSVSWVGTAKYIFMVYMPENGALDLYNQSKNKLEETINITGNDSLVLCGYEKFIPFSTSEGYIFKPENSIGVDGIYAYGVDKTTYEIYRRDKTGNYHPLDQ